MHSRLLEEYIEMYQLHYALREDYVYLTRRKLEVAGCVMLETEIYIPAASAWVDLQNRP
jgi:hypothetical protein